MAQVNLNKFLTIAIPTYNREKQLIRLLKSIERQDAVDKYYIVILNNHSNYDIKQSISNHFDGEFSNNIEIYNRPYNSGGDYNISSAFLFAKSNVLWIIGDDDEVLDGCFDIIEEDIYHYPDVPCFKYHIKGHSTYKDDVMINHISQFRDLFKKKYFSAGDIIFLSNNVFNLPMMGDYVSDSLYYSYCSVPHSLPMLRCMIDGKAFLLSHREIINYNEPDGDHWNYIKISTSLSTVLDINCDGEYHVVKDFFYTISEHIDICLFLEECLLLNNRAYRKYVCRKGMSTIFANRGLYTRYCFFLYQLENLTRLHFFTGFHKKTRSVWREKKEKMKQSNNVIYKIYKKIKDLKRY